MEAKNWVIAFAVVGVALLTVGIAISHIVEQERIPGSSPTQCHRYTPFDFQGFILAAIGGLIIIATIIGYIRSDKHCSGTPTGPGEIRMRTKGRTCGTGHLKANFSRSYVSIEA